MNLRLIGKLKSVKVVVLVLVLVALTVIASAANRAALDGLDEALVIVYVADLDNKPISGAEVVLQGLRGMPPSGGSQEYGLSRTAGFLKSWDAAPVKPVKQAEMIFPTAITGKEGLVAFKLKFNELLFVEGLRGFVHSGGVVVPLGIPPTTPPTASISRLGLNNFSFSSPAGITVNGEKRTIVPPGLEEVKGGAWVDVNTSIVGILGALGVPVGFADFVLHLIKVLKPSLPIPQDTTSLQLVNNYMGVRLQYGCKEACLQPPFLYSFKVQQLITPGSPQFAQLSAQIMAKLQAAGLAQALAQAKATQIPQGQNAAPLSITPQQIAIQKNTYVFTGVLQLTQDATASGYTIPAGKYLTAIGEDPIFVLIDIFTGQIVTIIIVTTPPIFTPLELSLFFSIWFSPFAGILQVPAPPWSFPINMPEDCSGLPKEFPFMVGIGSGATIVSLPGVMQIKEAGNALQIQSLGPELSGQPFGSLSLPFFFFIGKSGTTILPYSSSGPFGLLVKGHGNTVCLRGVVNVWVYGWASHN